MLLEEVRKMIPFLYCWSLHPEAVHTPHLFFTIISHTLHELMGSFMAFKHHVFFLFFLLLLTLPALSFPSMSHLCSLNVTQIISIEQTRTRWWSSVTLKHTQQHTQWCIVHSQCNMFHTWSLYITSDVVWVGLFDPIWQMDPIVRADIGPWQKAI